MLSFVHGHLVERETVGVKGLIAAKNITFGFLVVKNISRSGDHYL